MRAKARPFAVDFTKFSAPIGKTALGLVLGRRSFHPLLEGPKILRICTIVQVRRFYLGQPCVSLRSKDQNAPSKTLFRGASLPLSSAVILKVEAYDTQCGAKLFTPEAAKVAFAEPFISRWIFDVEILFALKNFSVIEYPSGEMDRRSRLQKKISREAFRVLKEIFEIRKRY